MGVINCHLCPRKVTSLACRTSFVFCTLGYAFDFHCWDDYWGVKNLSTKGTCSLLSACCACIWWEGTFIITSCWGSLLRASIGCTPSAWKCFCLCGWSASQIGYCGTSNSNCLLRALVITLDNFLKSII